MNFSIVCKILIFLSTIFCLVGNGNPLPENGMNLMYIDKDKNFWGLGSNYFGQLGDGTLTDRPSFIKIDSNVVGFTQQSDLFGIAISGSFMTYLKDDGSVWGTGYFGTHQGAEAPVGHYPRNFLNPNSEVIFLDIDLGGQVYFIKSNGSLWVVKEPFTKAGWENAEKIFDSGTAKISYPYVVGADGSLKKLGANIFEILNGGVVDADELGNFIKENGSLWSVSSLEPIRLISQVESGVVSLGSNGCFLKADGSVWMMTGDDTVSFEKIIDGNVFQLSNRLATNSRYKYNFFTPFIQSDGSLFSMQNLIWGLDSTMFSVDLENKILSRKNFETYGDMNDEIESILRIFSPHMVVESGAWRLQGVFLDERFSITHNYDQPYPGSSDYPVSFSGKISKNGINFNGQANFSFSIIDSAGESLWQSGSDGQTMIEVPVRNGRYLVLLGGQGMNPLPPSIFLTEGELYVRVSVDLMDGAGVRILKPDQRISSTPHALSAEVARGLLPGTVTVEMLAEETREAVNIGSSIESSSITLDMLSSDVISELSKPVTLERMPHEVLKDINRSVYLEDLSPEVANVINAPVGLNSISSELSERLLPESRYEVRLGGRSALRPILPVENECNLIIGYSDNKYYIAKVNSQGEVLWEKQFGGNINFAWDAVMTADGGYLIAGSSLLTDSPSDEASGRSAPSLGDYDFWVVKVNKNGTKQWDRAYGSSLKDQCFSIESTLDGNYILAGHTDDSSSSSLLAVKINEEGDQMWKKSFGGNGREFCYEVISTSDNGFLFVGATDSEGNSTDISQPNRGELDFWTLKTDQAGNKLWDRRFGGDGSEIAHSCREINDEGFVIAGYSNSGASGDKSEGSLGSNDFWVVKIDQSGSKIWDRRYGGEGDELCYQVEVLKDESYLLTGASNSGIGGDHRFVGNGQFDFWVLKVLPSGIIAWENKYGGSGNDRAYMGIESVNGGIIVSGHTESPEGSGNVRAAGGSIWTIRLDAQGNFDKTANIHAYRILMQGSVTETQLSEKVMKYLKPDVAEHPNVPDKLPLYGESLRLSADGEGRFLTYQWMKNGQPVHNQKSKTLLISDFGADDEGNYSLMISNEFGHVETDSFYIQEYSGDRIYDGEINGNDSKITHASDGNLILTGTCNEDFKLTKVTGDGRENIWSRSYGGYGLDICNDSLLTSSDEYLLVGQTKSDRGQDKTEKNYGLSDFWAVKTDSKGNKLWDRTFGGSEYEICFAVVEGAENTYLLAGQSGSPANSGNKTEDCRGKDDFWAVKIDKNGTKLWDKTFGGGQVDYCYTALATTDGNFLLAGSSSSDSSVDKSQDNQGQWDFWIVKINQDGNKLWDKRYGGTGGDDCWSIVECDDGSFILVGDSLSGIGGDKTQDSRGSSDFWVVKIDQNGTKIWDKRFGGSGSDQCRSIIRTADGNYLLCGHSTSGISGDKSEDSRGSVDFWVVKINHSGDKLWDKCFGSSEADWLSDSTESNDGSFFLLGRSTSIPVGGDKTAHGSGGWLVSLNSSGTGKQ